MASDTPSEPSSCGPLLSGSAVENDNLALPFRVEGQNANGRVVRLNGVVGEILAAHEYPEAVNMMLGEYCHSQTRVNTYNAIPRH